jgi:GTPase SAR1 family protein
MRTHLGAFASGFESNFQGVLDGLERLKNEPATADFLPVSGEDLDELRRRSHALAERVAAEEAYVLLFGPLKSGKSTLMNALSQAYVSEVSSLPGYPCLVQVSDAEEPSFTVTHYNGQEECFADLAAMRIHAQSSHVALAEKLREAEARGEAFEVESRCPEAIRKIAVRMPTPALAESSATLVDTPGLYASMKFDYDGLTKDYREVASCAVFVVKSDNLFLQQVFDEFGELLELFNRIFLVVNIDTKKVDLSPEGELVESLEQTDPARVVEAFENFSMRADMRQAAEEGRLRIYPIDLLGSAARRLRGQAGSQESAGARDAKEDEGVRAQSSFEAFLADLTSYLNGSEHLTDFIQDTLRRQNILLAHLGEFGHRPEVEDLVRREEQAAEAQTQIDVRRSALQRLGERDWQLSFEGLREGLTTSTRELAQRVADSSTTEIGEIVDGWLDSDASVRSLVEEDLEPLFTRACKSLYVGVARTLRRQTDKPSGGASESGTMLSDLQEAVLALDNLAKGVVDRVEDQEQVPPVPTPLSISEIPVKKGFWGWLFFRSRDAVRQDLFGPESNPDAQLSAAKKAGRLPDHAHLDMKAAVSARLSEFLSSRVMNLRTGLLDRYVELFAKEIGARLEKELSEITHMKREAEVECDALQRLRGAFLALAEEAEASRNGLPRLALEFLPQPEPEPLEELEELEDDELEAVEIEPMAPLLATQPEAEAEVEPAPGELVEDDTSWGTSSS